MASSNPIRELLSALFQAGAETILREEDGQAVVDDFLDPNLGLVDPDTNEAWDPPSLSE